MVCLCYGRQRSKLIEIFFTTGTIPSLLSAAGGWMNSTRYALSDKAARNFRKVDDAVTCDDKTGKADLLKSGVQIRVRLVVFAKLQAACDERRQNWKS